MIGALLSEPDPPQVYSHMGIVVEDDGLDGTHLRHCTTVDSWMMHESHYNGADVLGLKMPSDGFNEETLRYLCPARLLKLLISRIKLRWASGWSERRMVSQGAMTKEN